MNAIRRTIVLGVALLIAIASGVLARAETPTTVPATAPALHRGGKAAVVVIDGMIDDYNRNRLERRFAEAKQQGADVVILQINTYGGLVTAGLDISRFIKRQTDLHVVALVDEKAISAGAMIALSCDEIVMEPNTLIGDIGVIMGGGQAIEGATERAKAESVVLTELRNSAETNGYASEVLLSFTQLSRAVYALQNEAGERKFVASEDEYKKAKEAGWRDIPGVDVPLDGPDTLLTLSDITAEKIGISKGTFRDAEAFAASRGYTIVSTLSPGLGERFVEFLSGGLVRGLVVAVLFFTLYGAIKLPGTGVMETLVVCSLALLLVVPYMTGYAQWYEILLVLVGIVLIALEIFVIPGFGVAGISGIAALLLGLTLTFLPPLWSPGLPAFMGIDMTGIRNALGAVVGGLVGGVVLCIAFGRYLPSLPYFNRLVLTTTTGSQVAIAPGVPNDVVAFPKLGATGTSLTDLRPGGTAKFDDDLGQSQTVDVVSDRGFVSAGQSLVVAEVHGNRVVVRPA
jgi:membrane-bound serine protease (ClpP class)